MKKIVFILFLSIIFIFGCSTPDGRLEKASEIFDKELYQKETKNGGVDDVIIGKNKGYLFIVFVNRNGNIYRIEKISLNKICEKDNFNEK